MEVVRARPEDAGELITVQRAAFVEEGRINNSFALPPMVESPDEARAAIEDPDTTVLVARLGHRLVGSVRGRVAEGTGHVGRLSVAPDQQGRGIGRLLMAAIEAELSGRVARFEIFTGGTSEGNLRLYRSLGYVEFGRGPGAAPAGLAYLEKRVESAPYR